MNLNMKLVRSLLWTVLTSGADRRTRTNADEKRLESAELWIYRRMLRVSWTEHRPNQSILSELNTTRPFLGIVVRRKLSFFGHIIRDGGCELVRCAIQGKVNGKRMPGRHRTLYSRPGNITKWMAKSMEQIWKRFSGAMCDTGGWSSLLVGSGLVWSLWHHSFNSFHMS